MIFVTSVKPVHVATASLLSNLHFLSYKTDDKMNEFSNNLSRNITHIVLALSHWWQ
jgi:predicted RecB family endonuclease